MRHAEHFRVAAYTSRLGRRQQDHPVAGRYQSASQLYRVGLTLVSKRTLSHAGWATLDPPRSVHRQRAWGLWQAIDGGREARFRTFSSVKKHIYPSMQDIRVIAVLGPTGVGKSKLALELAERFNGEIISCDSMQVGAENSFLSPLPV